MTGWPIAFLQICVWLWGTAPTSRLSCSDAGAPTYGTTWHQSPHGCTIACGRFCLLNTWTFLQPTPTQFVQQPMTGLIFTFARWCSTRLTWESAWELFF